MNSCLSYGRELNTETYQWRIQDFPQGGRQLPKLLLFFTFLPKTAWKWKNLDPQGGGARPWRPPWIRQCLHRVKHTETEGFIDQGNSGSVLATDAGFPRRMGASPNNGAEGGGGNILYLGSRSDRAGTCAPLSALFFSSHLICWVGVGKCNIHIGYM